MKVSVLDLTVAQVADIEDKVGVPITKWQDSIPSMARLYALILSASTGKPESEFMSMTMRQLIDSVSFEDDDPNQ